MSGGVLCGPQPVPGPQEARGEVRDLAGVCAERGMRAGCGRHGVRVQSGILQHRRQLRETQEAGRCVRRVRPVRGERRMHHGDRRAVRVQPGLLQQHGRAVPGQSAAGHALHTSGHVRRERGVLGRHGWRVRVSAGVLHSQRSLRAPEVRGRGVQGQRAVHAARRVRQGDAGLPVPGGLLRGGRGVLEG